MTDYLRRIIGGWLEVRLTGAQIETVVSLLALNGFRIWRIRREGDSISCLIGLSVLQWLDDVTAEHGVSYAIVRQGGLPIHWSELKGQPWIWAGFFGALALVLYASLHIWAVDVTATNLSPAETQALLKAARSAGLAPGVWRNQLDIPRIRQAMEHQLPRQYSWIGIHVHGSVAQIDAIPVHRRPPAHLYPRLVADAAGTVTAVYVYMGAPDVLVGEKVTRGQVLISGVVSAVPNAAGDQPSSEESIVTPAEGEVWAQVRYQATVLEPWQRTLTVFSGRRVVRRMWVVDGQYIVTLPNAETPPFPHFQTVRQVTNWRWAGVTLPVQTIRIVYNEISEKRQRLTVSQARKLALAEAQRRVQAAIPPGGTVVRRMRTVRRTPKGVLATVVWVVNRNIAVAPTRPK